MNLLCSLFAAITIGSTSLPTNYKQVETKPGAQVASFGFEKEEKIQFKSARGVALVERVGRSGTRGIRIERNDSAHYDIATIFLTDLTPGKVYNITVWAKGTNLNINGKDVSKDCEFFALEYFRDKHYTGGSYAHADLSSGDWTPVKFRFSVPEKNSTQLSLFMKKKMTGIIDVDDITIAEEGELSEIVLLEPKVLTAWDGKAQFRFLADSKIPAKNLKLQLIYNQGDSEKSQIISANNDGTFSVTLSDLPLGKIELKTRLLNEEKREVVCESSFHCFARASEAAPANACTLDEQGRAIVDGKLFMPIGIYGLHATPKEFNYQEVKDAGFNTVISYIPKDDLALNLCQEAGLKLIYSIAERWHDGKREDAIKNFVEKYKNHPALLAWYISDEVSRPNIPKVTKFREMISAVDPWHPTWTLTYRMEDLPYYGTSGDILGVDPYPITAKGDDQHLGSIVRYMKGAQTTKLPIWVVPQIFNWQSYHNNTKAGFEDSRFATTEEIRSMPLLSAIMGAKGFIFYSYFDMKKPEVHIAGSFAREWEKVKEMVAVLKSLEPFIMSSREAPKVEVDASPKNEVYAKAFVSEKEELRVIIVGMGGKTSATITVDDKGRKLSSKYGLTEWVAPGKYKFLTDKVNSDILY